MSEAVWHPFIYFATDFIPPSK